MKVLVWRDFTPPVYNRPTPLMVVVETSGRPSSVRVTNLRTKEVWEKELIYLHDISLKYYRYLASYGPTWDIGDPVEVRVRNYALIRTTVKKKVDDHDFLCD